MSILEALWMGEISPLDRPLCKNSLYHKAVCQVGAAENQLNSAMDSMQKELLEKYVAAQTEMQGIAEKEAFSCGFRLGVQLLLAALEVK